MASISASELKIQGVIEAARDPKTNVTAQDAEHAIMQESRKAGAAAYQFNPNASPEEKAAQAKAVSLSVNSTTARRLTLGSGPKPDITP